MASVRDLVNDVDAALPFYEDWVHNQGTLVAAIRDAHQRRSDACNPIEPFEPA